MSGGVALQAILTGLSIGAVYGLVGVGFTLVWSLTRVLAFAHGDVVVGSVLLAVLIVIGRTPVSISPDVVRSSALVVLTLALGVALSVATYALAVRPFVNRASRTDSVMGWVAGGVTAGLVIRTAVGVALPAAAYAVPDALHLDQIGHSGVVSLPDGGTVSVRSFAVLAIALAIAVGANRFLVAARLGRAMRAVAQDADTAALCGVPVERVLVAAFAIAGMLAAIAGLLSAPAGAVSVDSGVVLGLSGAAAAVVGRLGHLGGAVVAGLAIGVLQQLIGVTPHFGAAWSTLVPLSVLLVVLAVRPGDRVVVE